MKLPYWIAVSTAALFLVLLAPQVGEVVQLHAKICANGGTTTNCWIHR